ncbi:MAG: hypothetical protein HY908_36720 [Myxococcales bacterium]|nr:hypothetical protein [Myxococcales bacterium]
MSSAGNCTIAESVAGEALRWKLRTRVDAVPVLQVLEGHLTARLFGGAQPSGLVLVERAGVRVQAFVGAPDLEVLLAKPRLVSGFVVPEGPLGRRVLAVEDGRATLDIALGSDMRMTVDVPCAMLGVANHRWAEQGGDAVYVDEAAVANVGLGFRLAIHDLPLRSHGADHRVFRGVMFGPDVDASHVVVAFPTCGATILASVSVDDIRPAPSQIEERHASMPCGQAPPPAGAVQPNEFVSCPTSVRLLVRSATFEDEVGVITAGAPLRIDGGAQGTTTLVSLAEPPAVPIEPAHFSVRTSDLAGCRR